MEAADFNATVGEAAAYYEYAHFAVHNLRMATFAKDAVSKPTRSWPAKVIENLIKTPSTP